MAISDGELSDLFTVSSDDTGWSCVSKFGETSYNDCDKAYNRTMETVDWTALPGVERCE